MLKINNPNESFMNKKESKFKLYVLFVLVLTVLGTYKLQAQKIEGVVLDENRQSVSGAFVSHGSQRTITDANGKFELNELSAQVKVLISKDGFSSTNITLLPSKTDTIILLSDRLQKVQLLHTKKDVRELSESVSAINGDVVSNLPGTNRLNTLAGRIPGLLVMQSDGQPGWEDGTLSIRGQRSFGDVIKNPTILVDGHEADASQFDAYDIESISVLKDAASTAMYGLRSANGIILINTKRGEKGKVKVSLNNQTAVVMPTKFPSLLNAGTYAELYNEALANETLPPLYTTNDIEAYRNGSDPIGHPNNDYFADYFAKQSIQTRNNLSLSGGNDNVLYRVSLGHTSNSGLLNPVISENTYKTNNSMQVINIHANVDVRVNDNLTVSTNLKAKKDKRVMPGAYNTSGITGMIGDALSTPANAYPTFLATDSLGGTADYRNNFYGKLNKSGYSIWERYYISGGVDFKYDFDFLKGLSLIGSAGYNNFGDHTINRSKNFAVYQKQVALDGTATVNKIGDDTNMANGSEKSNMTRFYFSEIGLGFTKTFGASTIDSKFLAESRMTETDATRLPHWNRGLKGMVDYSLQSKYLATFAFSYQGSEQFPKENRYGFFPAVSLGWVVSEEDFMKNIDFINFFKLRGSAGITGIDFNSFTSDAYFAYIDRYGQVGTTPFGTTLGNSARRFAEIADANDLLTWAKTNKLDIGFDASAFNNKLSLMFNYFSEQTNDLLVGGTPGILGIDYLYPMGIAENKGVEGMISWSQKLGKDFTYFLSANATYAKSTIEEQNEEVRAYPWMQRTGHEIGARFGYICEGFFTETDVITDYPDQSTIGEVIPGSLRYKDLNDDEIIDERDQTYLGNGDFPELWYGFSGGLSYKGFDLNAQFAGVANRTVRYSGNFAYAFNNKTGSATDWSLERWQPGDGQNATYPSLSLTKFQNNKATSTFWIDDADFLRLQSIELGYSLSNNLTKKIGLQKLRVFVTGNNLMTWSNIKRIDPAANDDGTSYPISKLFSAGLNLIF